MLNAAACACTRCAQSALLCVPIAGVVLDPVYTGKAVHALLQDMADNAQEWQGRKVLFVHTGGLLGLYDKAQQMQVRTQQSF